MRTAEVPSLCTSPDPSCYTYTLQTVVVDARAHMLGRLASIVAKQILSGHHVVSQDRMGITAAFINVFGSLEWEKTS